MAKLVYTEQEILADHPYAKSHEEAGYKLHGGFDDAWGDAVHRNVPLSQFHG